MEKPNYRLARTESTNVASILAGVNLRKNEFRALDRTFLGGCRCESDGYTCDCEPVGCSRDCHCESVCNKHCHCHSDCGCEKTCGCDGHRSGWARSGSTCSYNPCSGDGCEGDGCGMHP